MYIRYLKYNLPSITVSVLNKISIKFIQIYLENIMQLYTMKPYQARYNDNI